MTANTMREAFEKHAYCWARSFTAVDGEYCDDEVNSAWLYFKAGAAWQAAQSVPVDAELDAMRKDSERPDCGTCANRGRVNGLSQETFCEHCSWSEKWRKNHYKPIAMQERQP